MIRSYLRQESIIIDAFTRPITVGNFVEKGLEESRLGTGDWLEDGYSSLWRPKLENCSGEEKKWTVRNH